MSRLVAVHALKVDGTTVDPGTEVDLGHLDHLEVERLLSRGAVATRPDWIRRRIDRLESEVATWVGTGQRRPLGIREEAHLAGLRGELDELRREVAS